MTKQPANKSGKPAQDKSTQDKKAKKSEAEAAEQGGTHIKSADEVGNPGTTGAPSSPD